MSDNFIDFYQLLEVSRTASEDEIKQALKNQRRTWQKRQASGDQSKRHLAEEQMRKLDEANKVLLNAESRTAYDQQLASWTGPSADGGERSMGGAANWLDRAKEFLTKGDLQSASYAAREATTQDGANHEAWAIRGQTSMLLGNTQDAIFEYSEALRIKPNEPEYHFDLGGIYEQASNWSLALSCYERASGLAPANPVYRSSIASVHLQTDRPDLALPIMEQVVRDFPDADVFQYYLAHALNDTCVMSYTLLSTGDRVITTQDQAERGVEMLTRAQQLRFDDDEFRQMIAHNLKNATDAVTVKWRLPIWLRQTGRKGLAGSVSGTVGGRFWAFIAALVFCCFPAIIVVYTGAAWGQHPIAGLLVTVGLGFIVYGIFYMTARYPGWKLMDRETRPLQIRA